MNPPVRCLSRTLTIYKVSKASGSPLAVTSAGPPAADFGTASPCGGRTYGGPAGCVRAGGWGDFLTKKAGHSSSFLDSRCRGNCPTTTTAISRRCSPRRRLPASAACRVGRSTERLRAASCGRRGSAIASGFSPASWSVGSGSGPLPLSFLPGRRGPEGRARFPAAACALCSTRRATDRRRLR